MESTNTILFCLSLRRPDEWRDAIREAALHPDLDVSLREFGLQRLSVWLHRSPTMALFRWEGPGMDVGLERFATTDIPLLALWRGLLRVYAGPDELDRVWDSHFERLFSWESGTTGGQTQLQVFRGGSQVGVFLDAARHVESVPAVRDVFAEVRSAQGFTRVETWHQKTDEEDLVLTLLEGDDLEASLNKVEARSNVFDQRVMEIREAAFVGPAFKKQPPAELLLDWGADQNTPKDNRQPKVLR